MARTKGDGGEAGPTAGDAVADGGPGASIGGARALGARAPRVEEERLPDGRYILYYSWPRDADPARDDAPRGERGTGRPGTDAR